MPLIKLLRAMDGNKPMIGKIYDRMFTIGERIKSLENQGVSWASAMSEKHAARWDPSDLHRTCCPQLDIESNALACSLMHFASFMGCLCLAVDPSPILH